MRLYMTAFRCNWKLCSAVQHWSWLAFRKLWFIERMVPVTNTARYNTLLYVKLHYWNEVATYFSPRHCHLQERIMQNMLGYVITLREASLSLTYIKKTPLLIDAVHYSNFSNGCVVNKFWNLNILQCGFGGLGVACWPLVQVRRFKPGRSRRIFREKKSSALLPSEGK